MFLEDYHIHSEYSFDSQMKMEDIIHTAKKKCISEIAITDHVELAANVEHERNGNEAMKEIEKCREKYNGEITLRSGMELGNAQLDLKKSIGISKGFQGDIILGSVHNLIENKDVAYYNFRHVDCDVFFKEYLDAVYEIALNADFDILAHITYPLKAIYEQAGWIFPIEKFQSQLERIFQVLVRREKGIEINTSGLRVSLNQLLPDRDILKIYRECGGTMITIGSDAHEEKYIGEGIKEALACLDSLGYKFVTTYKKRIPIQHEIEVPI